MIVFDHFTAHVRQYQEKLRHDCEARFLFQMILDGKRDDVRAFLAHRHVAKRSAALRFSINQLLQRHKDERKNARRPLVSGTRKNASGTARENIRW